ncbi:MAG: 2-oxoacid:acceptor oxidoreductase family protein [Candidatus Margulisiibacteriota bacterium]
MKKSSKQIEVKFAGTGCQKIDLIANILAEAAFAQKYKVVMTLKHEKEVRCGLCSAEVIISDNEIDFPKCENLDVLVALSQEGYDASLDDIKKDTIQIIDSLHVVKIGKMFNLSILPLTHISYRKTKTEEYANFVALGIAIKKLKVIKDRLIINLIKEKLPRNKADLAVKSFKEGMKLS